MKSRAYLLAGIALCAVAVAQEDIESRMINKKTNGSWYVQPEKPKAKHMKADVLGGYAFRVKATKGVNPWDVQASSPVEGAINEGDVIMLHYYARAEVPAEGGSTLTARLQLAAAPYSSATAQQVIDLGPVMVFNFGKGYDTKKLAFCDG